MAFGEWLKASRGEMSQEVLAERSGVSKGYITLLESNKRTPSVDVAIALAKKLGKDPEEALAALAGKKTDMAKQPKKLKGEDELLDYYREMSPEVRKLGLQLFKRLAAGEELSTGKYDK